jgi:predicted permease
MGDDAERAGKRPPSELVNMLNSLWRDLRHAVRSLSQARAFTSVCVATLGIGMAPVIAIHFGLRMFTTPPPVVNPDGLVELITARAGSRGATDRWSYPDFIDLRDAATGMTLAGWARGASEVTLPASGEKRASQTMFVSSNYFKAIGVALTRGAGFPQDATEPVVILGHRFWQKRLAADPDIVGTKLSIDGVPHVVAGIGPERFEGHVVFDDGIDVYLPLERQPRLLADNHARFDRRTEWVRIHGRLSSGVAMTQAGASVSAITARLAKEYPATNELRAGIVAPYDPIGSLEGEDLPIVITAWHVIATLPLLVVCLNVAGMVQVRSAMRERELSIRQAIGASRRRLIQHLMAEAVVLAALGTALAFVMLFNIPPLVSWWVGEPLPALLEAALTPDFSMLAAAAGVCLAASLVFGWLPALRFSRPVIMKVLKDESGSGSIRAGLAHRLISALQVLLAVPLLILSAMSLERVRATTTADLGFASDQLYAAPIGLAGAERRGLIQALARADGVDAVTVADGLPLDFRYRMARVSTVTGANVAPKVAVAHVTRVGDQYLDTMRIPLQRGRAFTIDDSAGTPLVTIVSNALADRLFPDVDAIGQPLTFGAQGDDTRPPQTLTIVGVTADFPTSQMTTAREQLLLPLAQHPDVDKDSVPVQDDRRGLKTLMLIARSKAGEPSTKLTATLDNAIREVDRDFDRRAIDTGVALRERSIDDFLTSFAAGGISGGLTLLLGALGIYGVVGLMVARRTREIAVRFTLGASRSRVIGMILFDVVKLVAPGVAAGVLITAAVARLQGGVTISNVEPLAYVAGAAIAIVTAVLAALAPARRAASIEPMVAMRST